MNNEEGYLPTEKDVTKKRREPKKLSPIQKGVLTAGAVAFGVGSLMVGSEKRAHAEGPDATPVPITTTVKPEGPKPTPIPDAVAERIRADLANANKREAEEKRKVEEAEATLKPPVNLVPSVLISDAQGSEATQLWENINEGKGSGSSAKPKEGIDFSLANWPVLLAIGFFAWTFGAFKLIKPIFRPIGGLIKIFRRRSSSATSGSQNSGADGFYTRF